MTSSTNMEAVRSALSKQWSDITKTPNDSMAMKEKLIFLHDPIEKLTRNLQLLALPLSHGDHQ